MDAHVSEGHPGSATLAVVMKNPFRPVELDVNKVAKAMTPTITCAFTLDDDLLFSQDLPSIPTTGENFIVQKTSSADPAVYRIAKRNWVLRPDGYLVCVLSLIETDNSEL